MVRTIFSLMLGMLFALMMMLGLEFVGTLMFPMPPNQAGASTDLAEVYAHVPVGKLIWVLLGWWLAAFCGGWITARLAKAYSLGAARTVGELIALGVLANAWWLPQPIWMTVLGVIAPVPLAYLGGWVATRRRIRQA